MARECTCHPDDNPPRPCPQKFALTDCRLAASDAEVERILAMTDDEIIAEVGGPEEAERIAAEGRAAFERIVADLPKPEPR
jgi:hypothetical protein